MKPTSSIWFALVLALATTGCGENEDAQLTYEGDPLLLDTVNVCLFGTDGTDSIFTATVMSEEAAPKQVSITFGSFAEPIPGTSPADTISTNGSLTNLELAVIGQLDLVDFDPDLNTATSMLQVAGVLTDFSGTFPCFRSAFL